MAALYSNENFSRRVVEEQRQLGNDVLTSPGFWLRLQLDFELIRAARQLGDLINREVQPYAA